MKTGLRRFFLRRGRPSAILPAVGAGRRTVGWSGSGGGWLMLVLALIHGLTQPATAAPSEYQVKAVYLFNFFQFVSWPADAHASPTSPFVIGIVGADPFGGALDQVIKGERIGGRALEVHQFQEGDDVTGCHLLFIPRTLLGAADRQLRAVRGRPVLTVGEMPGLAARGAVINFVTTDAKVTFEINRSAEARQGLTISSKLLGIARVLD